MGFTVRNEPGLIFLVVFVCLWLVARWRVSGRPWPELRALAGYRALSSAVRESAESGRPVHLSLGAGGIGDAYSMQTMAGLQAVHDLAQPAATSAGGAVVTTASPVALVLAQDALHRAFEAAGSPEEFSPDCVRFVADGRAAYAVGAARAARQANAGPHALLGDLRDEYLILAEPAAQAGILLTAGSGDTGAQPMLWATASHPLLGEDLFAAGAYLGRRRAHLASLVTQDALRLLLALSIIAGVAARSLKLF